MEKAKVWFTDLRAVPGTSLQGKLTRLLNAAGFAQLDLEKKFVAIKINFGEPGNLSYLRANWARTVAEMVKAKGGIPFLTDCNTLYVGRRKNAVEHIEAAWENGFGPLAAGCPVIIADGLKGTDEVEVPVVGGVYCKTAKIGRAVMDADVVINLVHFKGHESTGFGGMISFTLDRPETVRKLLSGVNMILFAESLGGTETLITYPLTQTHESIPADIREKLGINECFVRISVGIEHVDDIIADLEQALA